jgi:hypothetical protein
MSRIVIVILIYHRHKPTRLNQPDVRVLREVHMLNARILRVQQLSLFML